MNGMQGTSGFYNKPYSSPKGCVTLIDSNYHSIRIDEKQKGFPVSQKPGILLFYYRQES